MIPNFLVFSFLRRIKLRQAMSIKTKLGPTDKPGRTWNDYSWTAGSHTHPRAVDATEEMGKLMAVRCAQPNHTNIVRNPRGESWLGPSWLGIMMEEGNADDLTLQSAWGIAEAPASLRERASICMIFSLHILWSDSYPPSLQWARKQWIQSLSLPAGCSDEELSQ